jgi:hypothetical protein
MFWLDTFKDTESLASFLGLYSEKTPQTLKTLKKSKRSYDLRLKEDKLKEDVFTLPEIKYIAIIQDRGQQNFLAQETSECVYSPIFGKTLSRPSR